MSKDMDREEKWLVVVNDEGQYSLWWESRPLPAGWLPEGPGGSRDECLAYIDRVWTDMRPRSLREKMESQSAGD